MLVFCNVMQYQEMCQWAEMQTAGLMLWWKQLFLISLCDAGQVLTCELIQYDSSQFCTNSFIVHHPPQTHGPLCPHQSRFYLLLAFSVEKQLEVMVIDCVSDTHKVITALIPLMLVGFFCFNRHDGHLQSTILGFSSISHTYAGHMQEYVVLLLSHVKYKTTRPEKISEESDHNWKGDPLNRITSFLHTIMWKNICLLGLIVNDFYN